MVSVKYGVPTDFIGQLEGKFRPVPVSDLDRRRRLTGRLSEIVLRDLHGDIHAASALETSLNEESACRHAVVSMGRKITPLTIQSAHKLVAPSAPRCGQFRVRRVGVDMNHVCHGFITSTIDVEKHLEAALVVVNDLEQAPAKVIALLYVLSFLHPFEDGNGRVMRYLVPVAGCNASLRGYAFWLLFSIALKVQSRQFAQALSELEHGHSGALISFYDAIVRSYEIFRSGVQRGQDDQLELASIKSLICEQGSRLLFC